MRCLVPGRACGLSLKPGTAERVRQEGKPNDTILLSAAAVWVRRARKRGVTLIEAVLFISIALGLIVGGLVFFQQASLAQRTADAVRTISAIASETRALYQTSQDFSGVTAEVLINAGAVPSNIVNADGVSLQNEWGGDANLAASVAFNTWVGGTAPSANDAFTITYTELPQAACVRLGTLESGGTGPVGSGILGIAISTGAVQVTQAAYSGAIGEIDPAEAARRCDGNNNTVIWVMGR
jgi:type II secretory pathway pseudopilin PulG